MSGQSAGQRRASPPAEGASVARMGFEAVNMAGRSGGSSGQASKQQPPPPPLSAPQGKLSPDMLPFARPCTGIVLLLHLVQPQALPSIALIFPHLSTTTTTTSTSTSSVPSLSMCVRLAPCPAPGAGAGTPRPPPAAAAPSPPPGSTSCRRWRAAGRDLQGEACPGDDSMWVGSAMGWRAKVASAMGCLRFLPLRDTTA